MRSADGTSRVRTRRQFLSRVLASAALAPLPAGLVLGEGESADGESNRTAHGPLLGRLKGPMASITIPYAKDYSVDHGSLRGWVDFMCDHKVPILFLTFGDGELYNLSEAEIEAVIRTVARQSNGRSVVVGGTGPWWTGRTLAFINRLADSGVDAMNVHFSSAIRKEEEVYGAFRELNDQTELPLLTYDRGWSLDLMKRLAKLPNVIGDKCHEQLYRYHDFIRATRTDNFAVLGAGQMKHFLFGYLIGSPAYLCPLTPFAPDIGLAFYHALEKNDLDRARQIMFEYEDPLLQLTIPLGYPQSYKSLLFLSGHYRTNLVRPPKISHKPEQLTELRKFVERLGQG